MAERKQFAVISKLSSMFFYILDCEKDELVPNEAGTADLSFRHRESAEYHADKLNNPEKEDSNGS